MGVTGSCDLVAEDSGRGTKRPIPEDECAEESETVSKRVRDVEQPEPAMNGEKTGQRTKEEHDLNLPLPWEDGTPCLVKVQFNNCNEHAS